MRKKSFWSSTFSEVMIRWLSYIKRRRRRGEEKFPKITIRLKKKKGLNCILMASGQLNFDTILINTTALIWPEGFFWLLRRSYWFNFQNNLLFCFLLLRRERRHHSSGSDFSFQSTNSLRLCNSLSWRFLLNIIFTSPISTMIDDLAP